MKVSLGILQEDRLNVLEELNTAIDNGDEKQIRYFLFRFIDLCAAIEYLTEGVCIAERSKKEYFFNSRF